MKHVIPSVLRGIRCVALSCLLGLSMLPCPGSLGRRAKQDSEWQLSGTLPPPLAGGAAKVA